MPIMPLITPVKVQMQKCGKCSREFCSSYNLRRHARVHTRVHRRTFNNTKESIKNRELLAAFWDKLSSEKAKDVISFNDVMLLKGLSGSTVMQALAASLCQTGGTLSLPNAYTKAGSILLDIVHSKPSEFRISSKELFSILDDASERTFLSAGTADLLQAYVFDAADAKHCLESKNVISTASFLFEKQLVKAWFDDKDAEALRCQNLLMEEEEAAQKRQAVLSERKRQKKLRQKEQKSRERLNDSNGDLIVQTNSVDTSALAQESARPTSSHSKPDSLDLSVDLDSRLECKKQINNTEHKDPERSQRQKEQESRERLNEKNGDLNFEADSVETLTLAQGAATAPSSDSKQDSTDLSTDLVDLICESQGKKPTESTEHKDQEHSHRQKEEKLRKLLKESNGDLNVESASVDTPVFAQKAAPPPSSESKTDSLDLSMNLDSKCKFQSKKSIDDSEHKDQEHSHSQKEQKSRERLNGSNGDLNIEADSINTPALAQEAAPPTSSESKPDSPNLSVKPTDNKDQRHFQVNEPKVVAANERRRSAPGLHYSIKLQRDRRYLFRANHQSIPRSEPMNKKVWAKKPTVAYGGEESSRASAPSAVVADNNPHQEEERSYEMMIGSIPIPLSCGASKQQDKGSTVASKPHDTCNTEHSMLMKETSRNPMKTTNNGLQSGAIGVSSKQWRPLSHGETKNRGLSLGPPTMEKIQEPPYQSSDESFVQLRSTENDGDIHPGKNDLSVLDEILRGSGPFPRAAAIAFLARRWKEAISSEHLVLVQSPRAEQEAGHDDDDEEQNVVLESNLSEANFRRNRQRNSKMKYIPKQKADA